MKMIKLSDDHYVVVDDSEIKEGDYYISWMSGRVLQRTKTMDIVEVMDKRITDSTQPIESGISSSDHTKKDYVFIKPLPLQEVKNLIGEVDVIKMAEEALISHPDFKAEGYSDYQNGRFNGIVEGYNIALENNKEKKYTEDDLRKAIDIAQKESWDEGGYLGKEHEPDEIIQTLQPKTEWDVEFDEHGKLTLV